MVVREQKVGGVIKRYAFLASSSDAKELSVIDVTNDDPQEVKSVNLPGDQDGLSVFLVGHELYFGRQSTTNGPELYVFDVTDPNDLSLTSILKQGEVGASVLTLRVSGAYVFMATSKSGQEFQVWRADFSKWDSDVLNAGRLQYYLFAHFPATGTGFDVDGDWVYAVSQFNASPGDALQVLYTTP
jgi:hypothetical protein